MYQKTLTIFVPKFISSVDLFTRIRALNSYQYLFHMVNVSRETSGQNHHQQPLGIMFFDTAWEFCYSFGLHSSTKFRQASSKVLASINLSRLPISRYL